MTSEEKDHRIAELENALSHIPRLLELGRGKQRCVDERGGRYGILVKSDFWAQQYQAFDKEEEILLTYVDPIIKSLPK